jgi:hypothetical protein
MSKTSSAVPKFYGKTLRAQFETLFKNPETPIVLIGTWNSWMGQRQCYPRAGESPTWCCHGTGTERYCDSGAGFDEFYSYESGNKVFTDDFSMEYSKDIEPAKNKMGDYYYQLMKSCIDLYKERKNCGYPSAQNELCCKDYR